MSTSSALSKRVPNSTRPKMSVLKFFQVVFLFQAFYMSCNAVKWHLSESNNQLDAQECKVLALVMSPFTNFNTSSGSFDGIDIRILRTIAERMNLKLTFTKVDDLTKIPAVHLE